MTRWLTYLPQALRITLALWFFTICASLPAESLVPPQKSAMGGIKHLASSVIDLNFAKGPPYYLRGATGPLTEGRSTPATCFDNAGNLIQVAAFVPCIAGGQLWSYEARTNTNPNNTMAGAGPGVWPTGWATVGTINGLTTTIVGTGSSQGMTYLRINVAGTATATASQQFSVTNNAAAAACAQNQVWSNTWQFRAVSGVQPSWAIGVQDFTAGVAFIGGYQAVFTPTSSFAPYTFNWLVPDATAALCNNIIYFAYNNTTTYNFTFDVAAPQFEKNPNATTAAQAFATPPILTTNAAATRNADNISLTVQSCTVASLLAISSPVAPGANTTFQVAADLNDGTYNNRTYVGRSGSSSAGSSAVSNVYVSNYPAGTWAQNVSGKITVNQTSSLTSAAFNNGTVASAASTAPIAKNKLSIGADPTGISQWNGGISRVALACGSSLTGY